MIKVIQYQARGDSFCIWRKFYVKDPKKILLYRKLAVLNPPIKAGTGNGTKVFDIK